MTIKELRESLGLTLDGFAAALGLSSKGHASDIERGMAPSVRVALEIERLSDGAIDASTLNADVARVRAASTPETGAAA